jgi:hypothetical protein
MNPVYSIKTLFNNDIENFYLRKSDILRKANKKEISKLKLRGLVL